MNFREPGLSCRAPGLKFKEPALGEPPMATRYIKTVVSPSRRHVHNNYLSAKPAIRGPPMGAWAMWPRDPRTTYSLAHSLTGSLTRSITRSLAHSLTHSLAHSRTPALTRDNLATPRGPRHPRDSKPHPMRHSRKPRTPNHRRETRETLNSARYPSTVNRDPMK